MSGSRTGSRALIFGTKRANLLNRPGGVRAANWETRFTHIEPRRLAMVPDLLLSHRFPARACAWLRISGSDDVFQSQ